MVVGTRRGRAQPDDDDDDDDKRRAAEGDDGGDGDGDGNGDGDGDDADAKRRAAEGDDDGAGDGEGGGGGDGEDGADKRGAEDDGDASSDDLPDGDVFGLREPAEGDGPARGSAPRALPVIVAGHRYDAPVARFTNWRDHGLYECRTKPGWKPRTPAQVDELVIHETVATTYAGTINEFKRKGLGRGTQLVVDRQGNMTQHADLVTRLAHEDRARNDPITSVGIEVINAITTRRPGPGSIEARWLRKPKLQYVLPSPAQCEAVWQLVLWLCRKPPYDTSAYAHGLAVRYRWPARKGNLYSFDEQPKSHGGIWAHGHITGNTNDGFFVCLYTVLRDMGHGPTNAFKYTGKLAASPIYRNYRYYADLSRYPYP